VLDVIEVKKGKRKSKAEPEVLPPEGSVREVRSVTIAPPKIERAVYRLRGTAPLVIAAFSFKAQTAMKAKHEAGSTAGTKRKREKRNFSDDVYQALHISMPTPGFPDGWFGFNATGLKLALVSACRTVGFKMTLAKLGIFVEADGVDKLSGVPLIRIQSPSPYEESIAPARNANGGFDLRARPMWREWWMDVSINFDADMFELNDIANLLMRAGLQVGIGEGRADSKQSCGTGWGFFAVEQRDA
jgi:hypothetical protein